MLAQCGCDGEGDIRPCGTDGTDGTRSACDDGALQHAANDRYRGQLSTRADDYDRSRTHGGSELVAGREDADLCSRWKAVDDSSGRRYGSGPQYGYDHPLYRKPRPLAGWEVAGSQLQHARQA